MSAVGGTGSVPGAPELTPRFTSRPSRWISTSTCVTAPLRKNETMDGPREENTRVAAETATGAPTASRRPSHLVGRHGLEPWTR